MKINGLLWIDAIVEKLEMKHGVMPDEVEEALNISPWFKKGPKSDRTGEPGYYCLGRTKDGRYLFVFFIIKKHQKALVITARDMTKSERKLYEKKN